MSFDVFILVTTMGKVYSGKVNFVLIEISFRFRVALQPVIVLSSGNIGVFGDVALPLCFMLVKTS